MDVTTDSRGAEIQEPQCRINLELYEEQTTILTKNFATNSVVVASHLEICSPIYSL